MIAHHTAAPAAAGATQLVAAVAQATALNSNAHRFFAELDEVRSLLAALRLAAREDGKGAGGDLYWPSLIEGLQRLMPDDTTLESAIERLADTLRAFNEDGAADAQTAATAPAAHAKRTTREGLATAGARQV